MVVGRETGEKDREWAFALDAGTRMRRAVRAAVRAKAEAIRTERDGDGRPHG